MTTLSSLIWTGVCLKTWWTSVSFNHWLIVSPNKLSGRDWRINTSISFNHQFYNVRGSHVHASLFCLIFMESAKCRILSGMLSLPTSTWNLICPSLIRSWSWQSTLVSTFTRASVSLLQIIRRDPGPNAFGDFDFVWFASNLSQVHNDIMTDRRYRVEASG